MIAPPQMVHTPAGLRLMAPPLRLAATIKPAPVKPIPAMRQEEV